ISALFAIEEGFPVPQEFVDWSREQLLDEVRTIEKERNFLVLLEGVAVSARHIETVSRSYSGYHVVQLFIDDKRVRLTAFSEIEDAESFYKAKETATRDDPNIAIVLMSAGALKDIKKAYPNYFLDTKAFLQSIRTIADL
ncbi:MAG: hypothetical protein SPJ12_08690, partial [Duodenibacillus sp.]|nr:hypothetical protein [Duodenibacillus sp.]